MAPEIRISKEQQEKITNTIINKIFNRVKLPKQAIDKIISGIDLNPIIESVQRNIPKPLNGINGKDGPKGMDAEITDDLISNISIKAVEQLQGIFKPPLDGKDGRTGEKGLRGTSGRDGLVGPQGAVGFRGPKGDQGLIGDKGDIGKQGPIGLPGPIGISGKTGQPGQDAIITDDTIQKVIGLLDLSKHVTADGLDKIIKKLIKDIALGRVEIPTQELGGGLDGPQLINEISRVLGQSDWVNGLPGDGTIGGNLNWFDLTDDPTGVPTGAGVGSWNMDEICLDVQSGIGPTLQVGQETYILIYNDLGDPIINGTVLRPKAAFLVGSLTVPTVEKAKSDIFSTVEGTIMVATMDIPVGEVGLATRFGRVRDVNTDGMTPGASIYIDPTTAGAFTTDAPEFPNYDISIGGVLVADDTNGEIIISVTREFSDTVLNFWNGTFRETIDFMVTSSGGVVTGSLSPDNGHDDMTMRFSDGYTMLATTPAITIVLTPGTADIPQDNFIYIPKSTKVLTLSTSDWPTTEHIKVANVTLRTATITENDGALVNRNWNDHIENTTTFQGHLPHITEKLRQFEAQWDSGTQGSATGFPSNFYVASTSGIVYQVHRQIMPALSMPTDDIHVVNNQANPYLTVNNLNGQTLDALGVTLANSSFSIVVWAVQNKTGQTSHLMCNLPVGNYAKNSPANAVTDAFNFSVYDIPKSFQGTGFLIARFTLVLEADGTTWSLFDTEDLRGKIPNTTAGGGAGGTGVTTWTGLSDTPVSYVGEFGNSPKVNSAETALEFTGSQIKAIRTETNDHLIVASDYTIFADASSNTVNVSLPATPNQGQIFRVFCTDSTFTCTVLRNGNSINGVAADQTLLATEALTVQFDTTYKWAIL